MATKKCPNGHQYDSSIYGDNCPFCPSSTKVNPDGSTKVNPDDFNGKTRVNDWGGGSSERETKPTIPFGEDIGFGHEDQGKTVIRNVGRTSESGASGQGGERKIIGVLVSFAENPKGELYKVYEGNNTIGRDPSCHIHFPKDKSMSQRHLVIQYVSARGVVRAADQGSSNGTYVNGVCYAMGDTIELKTNDVIILGATKLLFLAIPEF